MKKSRLTEEQIIKAIKCQKAGEKTADVCRDLGISKHTFYKRKSKVGGMDVSEPKKLRVLEYENRRLRQILAYQALDIQAIKFLLEKKF
jgi:putative transposase